MGKHLVLKDSTSRSEYIFIQDSSSTTGAGKTGLAFNTASLAAYYVRPLGSATAITLATQTVTGAWSSGGFVEVDGTNMPGVYRFDVPNAVFATGVDKAVVMLKGASNMATVALEYQLTGFDPAALTWLTPTTAGRTLDVTATGAAGIDWGNVENPTTAVNLSATNIDVDQVVASVSGAVGSVTGAVGSVTGLTAATVHSDLDDIQARLPAALTVGGNIKADALAINGSTAAAALMAILNGSTVVYQGTVTGAATTTTLVDSGLTQAADNWWVGRIIIFTSVITLQATDITGFTAATDTLTFTAVTSAPTGATYVII